MSITINYQPTELRATQYWFNALNGKRGELVFECSHEKVERSAPQNYMTFDGVQEVETNWVECTNCEAQWDEGGNLL